MEDADPSRQAGVAQDAAPPDVTTAGTIAAWPAGRSAPRITAFDRRELSTILGLYGRMVAAGEWRDYAIDCLEDEAIFSIFRRASEMPLYRVVKAPRLARRQGAFSVVAQGGLILKRGHDLAQVLKVLEKKALKVVG